MSPAGQAACSRGPGSAAVTGVSPPAPSASRCRPRVSLPGPKSRHFMANKLGPSCCLAGNPERAMWGPCGDTQDDLSVCPHRPSCLNTSRPVSEREPSPVCCKPSGHLHRSPDQVQEVAHHGCSRRFRGPEGSLEEARPVQPRFLGEVPLNRGVWPPSQTSFEDRGAAPPGPAGAGSPDTQCPPCPPWVPQQ